MPRPALTKPLVLSGFMATGKSTVGRLVAARLGVAFIDTDALLAEAGTDKRHMLSVQIFIQDFDDLAGMNRAWDAWIDPEHLPARATVQARLAYPDWRIEVTGVAAIP